MAPPKPSPSAASPTAKAWTGAERASLIGAINIADRAAGRLGSPWPGIADWPELDDGFPVHAPVVEKVEVERKGKVRRAKLYYARELKGKKAKIT